MYFNYQNSKNQTTNECILRGVCSPSPTLSYLQEVIKSYLIELSFYLLKLKEFGITNDKIKQTVLDVISSLIINVNYDEGPFLKIMNSLYADLVHTKELYVSICEKGNQTPEFPPSVLKKAPKCNLSESIVLGQKIFNKRVKKLSTEQKFLYDLIFEIAKSVCINLIELEGYDVKEDDAYFSLLGLINTTNSRIDISHGLQNALEKFVDLDHKLLIELHEIKTKNYGEIVPVKIPLSIRENKAILVGGASLKDLEKLLEVTRDRGIDVYTHGHLVIAHAFPKFKKYPHLVGHYGTGIENYLIDFASFPGAIFLTRHSMQKTENFYRSRIFTTDWIAPKGVMVIKEYNFEPLIESALSAKGFRHSQEKGILEITLDENTAIQKITEAAKKVEIGEIKHIFAIGVSNHAKAQKDYFDAFLKLLGDDSFVLSFSYTNNKDNVLFVQSDYGFPLLYKALEIFAEKKPIPELNISILFTRCEIHTFSNLIYLKHLGVKNIYFTDCPPTLVNPGIAQAIQDIFGLKKYTTPEADFKAMTES